MALVWLPVSEDSVHHGTDYGGQKREQLIPLSSQSARRKYLKLCVVHFLHFNQPGNPVHGVVLAASMLCFPNSISLPGKPSLGMTQNFLHWYSKSKIAVNQE